MILKKISLLICLLPFRMVGQSCHLCKDGYQYRVYSQKIDTFDYKTIFLANIDTEPFCFMQDDTTVLIISTYWYQHSSSYIKIGEYRFSADTSYALNGAYCQIRTDSLYEHLLISKEDNSIRVTFQCEDSTVLEGSRIFFSQKMRPEEIKNALEVIIEKFREKQWVRRTRYYSK